MSISACQELPASYGSWCCIRCVPALVSDFLAFVVPLVLMRDVLTEIRCAQVLVSHNRQFQSHNALMHKATMQLDQHYLSTNAMLVDCPVPRLSRAARLAKIDVRRSLLTPSCSAYAILEKFPTYMGQVGAKAARRQRPPMERPFCTSQNAKSKVNGPNTRFGTW